jgi:hypothetical protein
VQGACCKWVWGSAGDGVRVNFLTGFSAAFISFERLFSEMVACVAFKLGWLLLSLRKCARVYLRIWWYSDWRGTIYPCSSLNEMKAALLRSSIFFNLVQD